MLLTRKYAPKKLDEMVGNREKFEYVRQWILQCMSGKRRKPLLVHGPPGVGKTSLAYVLASEFDLDIMEMNASELRNKKRVERVLGGASLASSLFGRGKIILIDDADILAGRKDTGGATAIKNFLADSTHPIIVTASDIWDKKFVPIRTECEPVELKRINKASLRKHLETIAKNEGIGLSPEELGIIADESGGDMRAALNDLQSGRPSARNREHDIFNIVRDIFKAQTYEEAKKAIEGDFDYEIVKHWIDENIPYEYHSSTDVSLAYDSLSKADIFDGRIRKTNWKLLKYSIALSTAGVALAKTSVYRQFTKYNFPTYLRLMSQSVASRAMVKAVGKKIGSRLHVGAQAAREYFPIIKEIAKEHPEPFMDYYALEEDELAFLLGTSASRVRRKAK